MEIKNGSNCFTNQKLKSVAKTSSVPRQEFFSIATERQSTKTPPGFKDQGNGDFFVWVDTLFGLRKAQVDGIKFSRIAFITNDMKVDWQSNGNPHPVLAAEAQHYLGTPLEMWTVDKLATKISS